MASLGPGRGWPWPEGGPELPLGPQHIAPVGFVLSNGRPIGTCFVVQRIDPEMPSRSDFYMVTARHVVKRPNGENKPDLWVRFREYGGRQVEDWAESRWLAHDDEEIDLAVAPFPNERRKFRIGSLRMDTLSFDQNLAGAELGANVFYVGLLEPADQMGADGVAMVRSGTLGAYRQLIKPKGAPKPYIAHVIDCRSYGGFSGSPVFLQKDLPLRNSRELEEIRASDPRYANIERIGHTIHGTWLLGVLIIHYSDDNAADLASNMGLGIVVPSFQIEHLLSHRDCEAERVTEREIETKRAPKPRAEEASADSAEPYTEDKFLGDLRKVSKPGALPDREA